MNVQDRLAGAPISWAVCEVPGWGPWPAPEVVLGQMAALGLRGTELGAPKFLPAEPKELAALLEHHRLSLAGAFVALVLHERSLEPAVDEALAAARLLSATGGRTLVVAAVQDERWSAPVGLDGAGWRRLGTHLGTVERAVGELGVRLALHPHFGTLIETSEDIERALDVCETGWCLDTGHWLIGGADPARFVAEHGDRVVHVHLKDVDTRLAPPLGAGAAALQQATHRGLFVALGEGDAELEAVLQGLDRCGYDGWLVLEQDTAVNADNRGVSGGPIDDARVSIAFIERASRRVAAPAESAS